tara:strand:- start:955 stop:1338 length:384 start_codon:yes stop_codon:yes gene_type:complete
MKRYFVLLLLPIFSFGQIIMDKDYGEIDIRQLEDKYIEILLDQIIPSSHILSTSKYKRVVIRNGRKKKWNVYDNGEQIQLYGKTDVLNFFSKYGYNLASQTTESSPINYGNNIIITDHQNSIMLVKD